MTHTIVNPVPQTSKCGSLKQNSATKEGSTDIFTGSANTEHFGNLRSGSPGLALGLLLPDVPCIVQIRSAVHLRPPPQPIARSHRHRHPLPRRTATLSIPSSSSSSSS
ncbi:hypothetical protein CFP56_026535 [Quercus suber]|uniref:Uncharacterized protein n=1 Tax=Quercus suber TaxID=58331 RepID=A0AAW0K101_QUESU